MRVMFSGTWHTIADGGDVLNHPGHSSQKSHGRRGKTDDGFLYPAERELAEQGASILRRDELTDGHQLNEYSSMKDEYRTEIAAGVAKRWDVSPDDLAALIEQDRAAAHYRGMDHDSAKREYVAARMRQWESGAGKPEAVAAMAAVAVGRSTTLRLSDQEQAVTDWVGQRPPVQRALSGLGDAMYQGTQDWFAQRGITSVAAHRYTSSGAVAESTNLYTSWSVPGSNYLQSTSEMTRLDAAIPVDRIFSIPSTGFGNLPEGEIVVMPR